jgi:hypothetical protein
MAIFIVDGLRVPASNGNAPTTADNVLIATNMELDLPNGHTQFNQTYVTVELKEPPEYRFGLYQDNDSLDTSKAERLASDNDMHLWHLTAGYDNFDKSLGHATYKFERDGDKEKGYVTLPEGAFELAYDGRKKNTQVNTLARTFCHVDLEFGSITNQFGSNNKDPQTYTFSKNDDAFATVSGFYVKNSGVMNKNCDIDNAVMQDLKVTVTDDYGTTGTCSFGSEVDAYDGGECNFYRID